MRKKVVYAIFILALGLAACSQQPSQAVPIQSEAAMPLPENTQVAVTQPIALGIEAVNSLLIHAPQLAKDIQLADGKWSEQQADGSVQSLLLDEHYAIGDLNADGQDDLVVIVVELMGGTGVFCSITAFIDQDGQLVQTNSVLIDDRPVIHSLEIKEGEAILNATVHGPGDPMATPSQEVTRTYRMLEDSLMLWRQSQQLSDGQTREINIESPLENAEVSGQLLLTGAMPIAPFENTLLLQIFTTGEEAAYTAGVTVSAEDIGMPATFTFAIPLDQYPAGTLLRVRLSEVSMADGSDMAVDSVLVRVK